MRARFIALAVVAVVTALPGRSFAVTTIDASNLASIACVQQGPQSPCFAVGDDPVLGHGVIIRIVNGQPSQPIPVPGAHLFEVSCLNGGDCVAFGQGIEPAVPLIVFFDVRGVPQQTVTLPGTNASGPLACPTPNTCLVFGSRLEEFEVRVPTLTVVKRSQSTATTADFPSPGLVNDISCATPTRCIATGVGFDVALSGPQWTANASTAPFFFEGVSCPAPSQCFAATRVFLNTFPFGAIVPIAADGTVGTPVPMAQFGTTFFAITCVDSHLCVAVGENEQTTRGTIVRVVDGIPGAPADVDGVNFFQPVACQAKGKLCTATGRSLTGEVILHSFAV